MKIPFTILKQAHTALAVGGAFIGSYVGISVVHQTEKETRRSQTLFDYTYMSVGGALLGAGTVYLSPIIVPSAVVWRMTHPK